MTEEDRALPRKRDIEAAVAAYNAIDRETAPLPPEAARLLAAMFPRGSVCQRSFADLAAKGFINERAVRHLLRWLIEAGFLSKDRGFGTGASNIYHLHLPPVRR